MIDAGELLERARARTNLSDFGDESFGAPLERLVDALNREGRLSDFGQQAVPKILTGYLVTRLRIEDWYARHPEIDDLQIVAPVFGIGLGRTGSTALGHMLAQDHNTRSLRGWEAWQPCPPPDSATEDDDPRIAAAEARIVLDRAVPQLKNMVPRDPRGPEECIALLNLSFLPALGFEIWADMPSYCDWGVSSDCDMRTAYQYHRRVIKLLQWRCPPRRWFLRTPYHTFALDAIQDVYPDAKFIWTHRDPAEAIPSMSSLVYQFRRAYSDDLEPQRLGHAQERQWIVALERALAFRDRVGEERFFDISHRRQNADPVEQLHPLYGWLGWELNDAFEARIRQWQDHNPKGPHTFSAESFGLDPERLALRYRFYADRFRPLL